MKNPKRYKARLARQKRNERRKRLRSQKLPEAPRQTELYELIDGNYGYRPAAYCDYYKGWLTEGLINVHRCRRRHCKRLKEDWSRNDYRRED